MTDGPKKNLALDALAKIKDAEAEARKIVQDARENTSAKILQEADKDAEEIRERIVEEARKKAQEKKRSIIQDAEAQVREILEETKKEVDRYQEISAKTKNLVIDQVAENIRRAIEEGHL